MRNRLSFYIVVSFAVLSLLGALLPEKLYTEGHGLERLSGMSMEHLFGTDILGRDIFLRIVRGSYNVALIALPSVFVGVVIGGFLGLVSASRNTIITMIINSIMDILFAFPIVLLALAIVSIKGSHPLVATFTLSVFFIPVFYRVIYMASCTFYKMDYVVSARLSGLTNLQIMFKHIVPNIRPLVVTQVTIQIAMAILAEAGLGYLGLSVQPPDPTWGSLLLDAQTLIFIQPLYALPIGLTIFIIIWALMDMADFFNKKGHRNEY